jgi:hypothetical protein
MLENMTQDNRVVLAERICDLFVEHEAETEEQFYFGWKQNVRKYRKITPVG